MKKILWITRMAPADIDSAGLILQYRYLEILAKKYDITVLSMKEDYGTNPLKKLGIKALKYKDLEQLYSLLDEKFDVCVFSWWDIANNFLQKIRRHIPKIIINTVDVEFVRNFRQLVSNDEAAFPIKEIVAKQHKEIQTYSWADKLWFVTDNDKNEVIKRLQKPIPYDILPIIQKVIPEDCFPKKNVNKNFIYMIGNFLHSPNVDSALILCKDIFPKVLEKFPDMHLFIFGKWPPQNIQQFNSDNIHITGIVYDLEKRLSQMSACIAFLRYGAGLKGKVCEAMANGIPVIGTDIAFEGLDINEHNAIVANTVHETVSSISKIYNDYSFANEIGFNGYKLMQQFTSEKVESKIINSIEEMFV